MLDILIKGGTIIDGSGGAPYIADVGIKNGKIEVIGHSLGEAREIIDASGLTVTPGFIDSHSHADDAVLSHPDQTEKCEQGITTSIGGQCGSSLFPDPQNENEALRSSEAFFEAAEKIPEGANIKIFVGHSRIRRAVMGLENRRPTDYELEEMCELVRRAVRAGAIGLSFGLIYHPSCYAETDELIALAKACASEGGMLSAHIRNEGDLVIEAVKEFIDVVKASGARGVISHHKAAYKKNHGKLKTTLKMIDEANAEGYDVYCDVYPYVASSTSLTARFVPKEYRADGKTLENLKDPETRRLIHDSSVELGLEKLDWVLVTYATGHPEFDGKYVSEIARELGCDDIEAALRVIELSSVSAGACYFSMCEEDVERVIAHPRSMICTDSSVAKGSSKYHPRLRAAFPRAIAKYVRERGVVTLPEMIRKMTSLPAHVYGLQGKGLIKEGYDADLCIFDYERLQDKATFVDPSLRSEGLNYVIISGKVVCRDAVYNGTRAGKVIKKQ